MQDTASKALEWMEKSMKGSRIFIDTCSLMSEQAERFWANMVPLLQKQNQKIVIPYRVYEEVKKYADNPALCAKKSDPHLNEYAGRALKSIVRLQRAGLAEVFGDPSDNFADNVFQTVFIKYRMKYDLLLITQDTNLAHDILLLNESRAVTTKKEIKVRRINTAGFLGEFRFDGEASGRTKPQQKNTKPRQYASKPQRHEGAKPGQKRAAVSVSESECFAIASAVKTVEGSMSMTAVPQEGDVLTAVRGEQSKRVKLCSAVASGGEGTIYTTDIPGIVAKIYKREKLDRTKFEKLRLMMTKDIDCEGVCFPMGLLYNRKDEFVGYLMRQAKGKELQKCVFIPALLRKNFPNWTKADTVALCITILEKLQYLHERNIILGDINPNNILVVSPSEVYFVDTDSYQVEGFPCPVGTINFTAPEIQHKKFPTFLRTIGNERFAVATLLFMIMLPGKPPYAMQGGENQIDNIINGDFAYASGSRSNGKAPEGVWRYCWSHLPRYLKDKFYETFRKDGQFSTEATRLSDTDWLSEFKYYTELLHSGKLQEQDAMSIELFPTRLKKNPKVQYVFCRLCGREVDKEKTRENICWDCLNKEEIYTCAKCGGPIKYSNYQKYIRKAPRYDVCWDCYQRKNMVYKTIRCPDCGEVFNITYGEKDSYDAKGFQLPKRCKNCRGHRAYAPNSGSAHRTPYGGSHPYHTGGTVQNSSRPSGSRPASAPPYSTGGSRPASNGSGQKSGFCFITTAVCGYLGKPDDCYELTMLRRFRDGWLAVQPGGDALIREYYRVAPPIVRELDGSADRDRIYQALWQKYIRPCVSLIEQNRYEECRGLYETMVNELKKSVLKECQA